MPATNGFAEGVVRRVVDRLEELLGELGSERGQYMERCRRIRDTMKDVYQAARDEDGIPKKALKTLIEKRELAARIEDLVVNLEGDNLEAFQSLEQVLGDYVSTPLGQAARTAADMAKRMDENARGKTRRKRRDIDGDEEARPH